MPTPTTFQRPVNNFSTTLATGHTNGDGSLVLATGAGALLGALASNQKYVVTASDASTGAILAIFKGTGLGTDTITGVTAVEGTSDLTLAAGTIIEVRPTAGTYSDLYAAVNTQESSVQWGYVSAQFDKTNATLADVTGLSANLTNGGKYGIRVEMFLAADATGGIAYTLGGTATVTIRWASELTNYAGPTLTPEPIKTGTGSGSAVTAAGGTSYRVVLTGAMTCTAGGTLTVQFAQSVANGTSSVLVGSWTQVVALT